MSIISKKICLIGDFSVGKTSLIRRFIEDKFSDKYLTTIGVKISRKPITIEPNTQQINLLVWDIEGQTKQTTITTNYLQGAHGAIVVGDLTRTNTLKHIPSHLELFLEINPQCKTVVALNKFDLVSPEKLDKLVELNNFNNREQVIDTYVTSAKTGDYVNTMFKELAASTIA
ncbi:Small GTP-binding protein domain protein [Hyella patelloides LEGE 07179]|uniref:Small GTP-binding protein domain protein n=1 Tax=Hyella patelloides LEGE 07179 TaxID=945734 RepID=A0A563W246_9CYAN|nr:Rab family GTPase [Hyella patelloides]VEP17613.1 Small GTP-binding protein domain protein [Hyella patelloides LEGE 07179]